LGECGYRIERRTAKGRGESLTGFVNTVVSIEMENRGILHGSKAFVGGRVADCFIGKVVEAFCRTGGGQGCRSRVIEG